MLLIARVNCRHLTIMPDATPAIGSAFYALLPGQRSGKLWKEPTVLQSPAWPRSSARAPSSSGACRPTALMTFVFGDPYLGSPFSCIMISAEPKPI